MKNLISDFWEFAWEVRWGILFLILATCLSLYTYTHYTSNGPSTIDYEYDQRI